MSLSIGSSAPDFQLPDFEGVTHSLSDYKGKWVLLYFYPKDDTPGCTKEACSFRDSYSELSQSVEIIGVSADSVESHKAFKEKYHLPFLILSDSKKEVIHSYQVDGSLFPKRTTFLINPAGQVAKVYDKVNVNTHTEQILRDVQGLKSES
jgi:peroxiredoxin Q/BCP